MTIIENIIKVCRTDTTEVDPAINAKNKPHIDAYNAIDWQSDEYKPLLSVKAILDDGLRQQQTGYYVDMQVSANQAETAYKAFLARR